MSDRTRQALAFVIAIGMVIAVASAPTVAQVADPGAEQVFELAGYNADSVDGRHAVGYTTNRGKRAGKLVAANSNGFLPSNILKPQWRVIQNMPGGFADGVDDRGVTNVRISRVYGPLVTIGAGATGAATATCPSGYAITGGGWDAGGTALINVTQNRPNNATTWHVAAYVPGTSPATVLRAVAVCERVWPDDSFYTTKRGNFKPGSLKIVKP